MLVCNSEVVYHVETYDRVEDVILWNTCISPLSIGCQSLKVKCLYVIVSSLVNLLAAADSHNLHINYNVCGSTCVLDCIKDSV